MSYLTRNFPDNYPDIVCMCEHLCLELEDLRGLPSGESAHYDRVPV